MRRGRAHSQPGKRSFHTSPWKTPHENLSRDSFGVHRPPPATLGWPRSRPPGEDLRGQSCSERFQLSSAPCWTLVQDCLAPKDSCWPRASQALSWKAAIMEGRDFKRENKCLKNEPQMDSEGQIDIHFQWRFSFGESGPEERSQRRKAGESPEIAEKQKSPSKLKRVIFW